MTHLEPAPGRQLKVGVTFLAWLNIYQNLKQAIQDVIAPEMQQLRGEIKALSAEIGALHQRIDSLEKSIDARFEAVNQRFDAVDKRFDAVDKRFDGVDRRIDLLQQEWPRALDIYERLAALEARLDKQ
jgi:prefoldin subunit 5